MKGPPLLLNGRRRSQEKEGAEARRRLPTATTKTTGGRPRRRSTASAPSISGRATRSGGARRTCRRLRRRRSDGGARRRRGRSGSTRGVRERPAESREAHGRRPRRLAPALLERRAGRDRIVRPGLRGSGRAARNLDSLRVASDLARVRREAPGRRRPRRRPCRPAVRRARTDFGKLGWGGPRARRADPVRYLLRLHACDKVLGLAPGATAPANSPRDGRPHLCHRDGRAPWDIFALKASARPSRRSSARSSPAGAVRGSSPGARNPPATRRGVFGKRPTGRVRWPPSRPSARLVSHAGLAPRRAAAIAPAARARETTRATSSSARSTRRGSPTGPSRFVPETG